MSSEEDDGGGERVLILEARFRGIDETLLVAYREWATFKVSDMKREMGEQLGFSEGESMWVVHKGRKLVDGELVKDLGLENYSRVYVGMNSQRLEPVSVGREKGGGSNLESLLPGGGDGGSPPPNDQTLDFSNRIGNRPPASNALAGVLAQNPEMMLELLQMNPRMKAMMDRNPQIRHALSDPATLQEILATGSNPRRYQEAMRGHDRALANIENLPGGFQALQQFYTRELADVESSMGELCLQSREYKSSCTRTTAAMPNPWAKPFANHRLESSNSNWEEGSSIQSLNGSFKSLVTDSDPLLSSAAAAAAMKTTTTATAPQFQSNSSLGDLIWSPSITSDTTSSSTTSTPPLLPSVSPPLVNNEVLEMEAYYEAHFQAQLAALQEMGFTNRQENIQALLATGGNILSAIEHILGQR